MISELGLEIDDVALEISRRKDVPLITDADYFEDVHSRKLPLSHNQQEAICAMFDLYHEYQETMRLQGKDCADYEDIPDLTLNALFGHKLERSYDIIMIDEAQDWAPKWIKIIKRLLKAGGYLFICDDPAQSLWRFFDWKQKGIKNYTPYHLQLPERTTREIMDCAQSLFDIDERIHFEQDTDVYPVKTDHLISGNKPIVLQFTSTEEEISKILSRIDQWLSQGMKGKQIAILCPCFADTRLWIKQELIKNNDVYVGHFNQMKGLEFNTVFIPQIDGAFVKEDGRLSATSSIAAMRRLFVAMTRARENLILSSSKSFPEILTPLFKYSSVENW